eukprot:3300242-Prymnesium_polylepis.1
MAAGIPSDAVSFAFAYPADALKDLVGTLMPIAPVEPWLFFLLVGGFIYVDQAGDVCSVTAISPEESAGSLFLHGPFPAAQEAIDALQTCGRLKEVTFAALREAGFESFAWVNPSEAVNSSTEEGQQA